MKGAARPLPLHQDLYLIAHNEAGKLLTHQSSISLGLAGAVLMELALRGRVAVGRGRVVVTDGTGVGDEMLDGLLALLARDRDGGDLRFWIRKTAENVYGRTREALVAAGALNAVIKRRLGLLPYVRHQLADITWVVRASSEVRSAAAGAKEPDERCAALCGLVAVLRVESELYLGQPSSRLVPRLRAIADERSPVVRELVGVVDALIDEAALAVYR